MHCGGPYMAKWTYFLLDAGALGTALVLAWRWQWWRAWLPALIAISLVGAIFITWDIAAAQAGHWAFNDAFVLGWRIYGLPFEEYLFFAAIGLVTLAMWGLQSRGPLTEVSRWWLALPAAAAGGLLVFYSGKGYSMAAAAAALITVGALLWQRAILTKRWLHWQAAMLVLFIVFNTCLTALPIVTYGAGHFSGLRLGTIPLEDFLYNFTLTNSTLLVYVWFRRTKNMPANKLDNTF